MESAVQEVLELVDRIADLESQIRAVDADLATPRQQVQVIHASTVLEVSAARDEKGRFLYPNAKSREAAVIVRLSENLAYQGAKRTIQEATRQREQLIIEQMRLQQRRDVLMAVLPGQRPSQNQDPANGTANRQAG